MAENTHYESDAISIDLGDLEMDSVLVLTSLLRSTRSTRRSDDVEAGPSAQTKRSRVATKTQPKPLKRKALAPVGEEHHPSLTRATRDSQEKGYMPRQLIEREYTVDWTLYQQS